jgi:regulator of sigma E protease
LLSLIFVFLVFSVLILVHELGHLFAAKKCGIRVDAFSIGMGRRLCGFKIGQTDYRLSLIPFGGFCKMAGDDPDEAEGKEDEMASKPVGYRFWVIGAGSIANYIFAIFLFWIIFMIGIPTLTNQVGQVLNGYPAASAGIESGDRILMINDRKVEYWEDILEAIKDESKENESLVFTIDRDDNIMKLDISPDISEVTNVFGQTISRPMVGIGPHSEVSEVSFGPGKALYYAGNKVFEMTGMTYKMLWLLITGGMPVKGTLTGPIGIAYFIKDAVSLGIVPLLLTMANISLALAIFNVLPFPVLDGGHIVFLLFEKIKKKPLSVKIQDWITQIAIILLISFALFVSWQDVIKFTPFGKMMAKDKTEVISK